VITRYAEVAAWLVITVASSYLLGVVVVLIMVAAYAPPIR
jgi:hypothetical protein